MSTPSKKIGIVGGGKVGLNMFHLFNESEFTEVAYVVDVNANAPARMAARQAGVPAFVSINDIKAMKVDFIVEVTGIEDVVEQLSHLEGINHSQLITHDIAYVITKVIEESNRRTQTEVVDEVGQIQDKIDGSLKTIEDLVHKIDSVTSEMGILSLNARIEAARAGESGRGFAVVSEQMGKSVDTVRQIADQIDGVNHAFGDMAKEIQTAINRLD